MHLNNWWIIEWGVDQNSNGGWQVETEDELLAVELSRGAKGFGFSIRGGREFGSMPLFVLRIAEGGPAALDGRLRVGDQLIQINACPTIDMTHERAIQLIKREPTVKLLVKRSNAHRKLFVYIPKKH